MAERTDRLVAATDDVARHVLRDNYEQNVLLGVAREMAPVMVNVHRRMIRALEAAGELDRGIEFLPSDAELAARADAGEGLSSPELAVLAAYAKIGLTKHLVDSTLPDEKWFARVLRGYFPAPIVAEFPDSIATHPLGREITTTVVVNDMVNRAGISFAYRAVEETGVEFAEIARAYTVVREIFGLESLWRDIEALDGVVAVDAQLAAYSKIRRVVDRSTRWLADVRFPISDVGTEIARFGPAITELAPQLPELLCGVELTALETDTQELAALGLPHPLALRISELLPTFLVLDVVEIAAATNEPVRDVAALLYALSARLSVDVMLTDHAAAARRPLVDVGPGRAAARPLCGVEGDHHGRPEGDGARAKSPTADHPMGAQQPGPGRPGDRDGHRGPRSGSGRPRHLVGGAAGDAEPVRLTARLAVPPARRLLRRPAGPRRWSRRSVVDAPAGRQRLDEGQAPTGHVARGRMLHLGLARRAPIGHPHGNPGGVDLPSDRHLAAGQRLGVPDRVADEFGHDQHDVVDHRRGDGEAGQLAGYAVAHLGRAPGRAGSRIVVTLWPPTSRFRCRPGGRDFPGRTQ